MQQVVAFLTDKKFTKLVDQLRPIFKNVPHLPKGVVSFLTSVAPWIVGLGGVMGIITSLTLISYGLGMSDSLWMRLTGVPPTYFLLIGLAQIISSAIMLLAFKPLREKQKTGWYLLFWTMALGFIQSTLAVFFNYYQNNSVVGIVIGLAIGLYVMFEVEGEYNKKKAE